MKSGRYLIRFVKCFIYLTCWVLLILALMILLNQTEMSFMDLFTSTNGMWMWVFVFCFSFIYPVYGYVKRDLSVDASKIVPVIDEIAGRSNLARENTDPNEIVYRGNSIMKKLLLQFEDRIVIRTVEGKSVIEGSRKEVVKIIFRLDTYLISQEKR